MVSVNRQRVMGEASQRSWLAIVNALFADHDMEFRAGSSFEGKVACARVGGLDFARVVSSDELSRRTARHVARDEQDRFVLVCVKSGSLRLTQDGRECRVAPGGLVLYDLNRPSVWHHSERTDILNFAIPGFMLRARLRNLGDLVVKPRTSQTGLPRIAADLLDSVWGQLEQIPETAASHYARHLVEVVSLAFEAEDHDLPIDCSSTRVALYRRAGAYINAHLADHDLNPAKVAEATGISVRYLHQVFEGAGETVGGFLRNARLAACHANLADPTTARLSIAEIAFRAGFRNPAHFATAFKARYGMSASERRRSAQLATRM